MAKLAVDSQSTIFAAAPGSDEGTLVGRNSTSKVGFYGKTPVARPVIPASPTAADISAVLVALGLATQAS